MSIAGHLKTPPRIVLLARDEGNDPRVAQHVQLTSPFTTSKLERLLLETDSRIEPAVALEVPNADGTDEVAPPRKPVAVFEVPQQFVGSKILLVEDNPVNQLVAEEMLASFRCRVDLAANGREAIDMLSDNQYDLVLMDCQMPIMGGLEATISWRQNESQNGLKRVPILGLTAHALPEELKRCVRCRDGCNDCETSQP